MSPRGSWSHLLSPHRSVHVDSPPAVPALTTSYVRGTYSAPLVLHTVGEVLQRTVERFPEREALVFVEQGVRKTFAQFQQDVSLFTPTRSELWVSETTSRRPRSLSAGGWCRSRSAGNRADQRRQALPVGPKQLRVGSDAVCHSQSWNYPGRATAACNTFSHCTPRISRLQIETAAVCYRLCELKREVLQKRPPAAPSPSLYKLRLTRLPSTGVYEFGVPIPGG